jgi:hypothetical protein
MSTAASVLTPDARLMTSPYKELKYYEEGDSENFAGREQDVHQLLSRVVISRAFVLYARSGLGKTSVLLAGLFPELRKRDYRPIYVRTLEDPLRDLKAAVAREGGLSAEGNSLRALLQEDCEDGSPVIALDQFEEFFIRFRDQPAKRAEFVREVAAVIADESVDARVIFSVREDYLAALDDMQRRLPHLFTQSYRLMPLTAFGAREAIVRPLLQNQVPYDERLVTRLVDELAKFDFESARLQITCAELYRSAFEREGVQIHLSEEDLGLLEKQLREMVWKSNVTTYGSVIASSPLAAPHGALLEGVFQRYLQRAIAPVEERYPFLSRLVLEEMITRQETKYAIPLSELSACVTGGHEALREVLESLADRNLVHVSTLRSEPLYEIVHECLVPEIRRWLALNEEFVGFRDALDLIVTGSSRRGWRRQTAMLLPREQLLKVIAPQDDRLKLDPKQVEFVLRSAIYHGTDDLPFWASKYAGNLAELIVSLLGDPTPEMRVAAAMAAGRLRVQDQTIVQKCLQLALKADEPSPVRRAAGETLAAIATDEQLAPLRQQCRWRNTPAHVRDLFADLAVKNRLTPACGTWWNAMAKRHARRRLIQEHAAEIEAERWSFTKAGFWGGLGWTFTTALACSVLGIWLGSNPSSEDSSFFLSYIVGSTLFFALPLGALTGWGIGRSRVCAGLQGKRALWLRSISGSRTLFWLYFTVGLLVISSLKNLNVWVVVGLLIAWGLLLRLLIACTVELSRPCFAEPISRGGAIFWSFITSLVLGVVPTFALLLAFSPWLNRSLQNPDQLVTVWTLVLVSVSLSIYVANFTLAVRDGRQAAANHERRHTVVARFFFVLAALLVLPAFFAAFGPASSPLLAQRRSLPDEAVSAYFRFWPETDYFRLVSQPDTVFHVTVPPAASLRLGEGQTISRAYSDSLLKFPTGLGPLAILNGRKEHGSATATAVFRKVARLGISKEKSATLDDPVVGKLQGALASEADGRTSLTLSGKLPAPLPAEEVIKVFLFDPETSQFLSDSDVERQGIVYLDRPRPWIRTGGVAGGERFLPFRVLMEKEGEWSLKLYRQERLNAAIPGKQVEEKEHLAPDVSVDVGVAVVPIRGDEMAQDAEFLAGQERFAEAAVLGKRALEMMEPNPHAYYLNLQAWTLFRLGEFKESLEYARRAVALDDHSNYLDTYAHAAYSSGLWREAVEAWDRVLARDGRFTNDAYCKEDAQHYATARAKAGLPPRPLPQKP